MAQVQIKSRPRDDWRLQWFHWFNCVHTLALPHPVLSIGNSNVALVSQRLLLSKRIRWAESGRWQMQLETHSRCLPHWTRSCLFKLFEYFWKMRMRIGDCSIQGCLFACRMGESLFVLDKATNFWLFPQLQQAMRPEKHFSNANRCLFTSQWLIAVPCTCTPLSAAAQGVRVFGAHDSMDAPPPPGIRVAFVARI